MYEPILHVVLHEPEIAENTGNAGRTCVAVGAKLWLVRPLAFRIEDRRLRRSGMDYWQHLVWEAVDDWNSLLRKLPDQRMWFFTKTAATPHSAVQFARGDVLVFGSESRGLPQSLLAGHPEQSLRIPMRTDARSLNLSVAVGVAVYEGLRQIGPEPDKL